MDPFSALNLVFLIPLAVGLLFAIGAALGVGGDGGHEGDHDFELEGGHDAALELEAHAQVDMDIDADMDSDFDAHVDADHADSTHSALDATVETHRSSPLWLKLLSFLGFGRVPMTIVLMVLLLLFGGIGICGNILLGSAGFVISVASAGIGAFLLTGIASRIVGRLVPSMESSAVSRNQLCGKVAKVSLASVNGIILAHVQDESGTLHQIPCSVDKGVQLTRGDAVIIVSYDKKLDRFLVEPAARHFLPNQ